MCILVGAVFCAACSNGAVTTQYASAGATAAPVALTNLHWCDKPMMVFRDEGSAITPTSTPQATVTPGARTLTDWSQFETTLSFKVFLPASLPGNTCLLSVSGTAHDPVLGSSFTIGYLLPDHSALTLSEAPVRDGQAGAVQCRPSSTSSNAVHTGGGTGTTSVSQYIVQLCSGVKGNTSIVFSARGTTTTLRQLFQSLRPGIAWLPT